MSPCQIAAANIITPGLYTYTRRHPCTYTLRHGNHIRYGQVLFSRLYGKRQDGEETVIATRTRPRAPAADMHATELSLAHAVLSVAVPAVPRRARI